mgnify:CR=1 FL=1
MKVEGKYVNVHQALIDRCREGDSLAQFEIYKLYYKAMYNTCFRIVNDTSEAEDIMQESFFKAFDKLNTYRNEVSFGAWLKRIVVNSSLVYLKKGKILASSINEVVGLQNKQEENSEEFIPESVEQLRDAMQKLPSGYKLIVNLVLVEGYTHDEVAVILNISASTSRSQLARAKKRLIELMNTK